MGRNDHVDDDDEGKNLPPEAYDQLADPFEIDDEWLRIACDDEKLTAMRAWFRSRYCDPAEETPYNGREGGYLFVHGGPHDPGEVLPQRFGNIVDEALVEEVVDEMHAEHGDQWAPIDFGPPDEYFDERFDLPFLRQEEPLHRLRDRLRQTLLILTLQGNSAARELAEKLVFGAVIGALEAFLWETVSYWVENDAGALRDMVTRLPKFKEETIKLSDIFDRHASLKSHLQGYLQHVVWHRWDQVAPLFKVGLGIELDSTKAFQEALVKRHDIVHRSGHDKNGVPITVTSHEIEELCGAVVAFCVKIEARLSKRSEPPDSEDPD